MSTQATPAASQDFIAAYKAILRDVLDRRPSGMRQRLAEALGKNRSFITQIAAGARQTSDTDAAGSWIRTEEPQTGLTAE